MNRACVNRGGSASRIKLSCVPELETPTELDAEQCAALSCWNPCADDILTISDSYNADYRARLERYDVDAGATLVPLEKLSRPVEAELQLEVCLDLSQSDRLDLIVATVAKLTELGVASIIPFTLSATDVTDDRHHGLLAAVSRAILIAARTSQRAIIPELSSVLSWEELLWHTKDAEVKLILGAGGAAWTLSDAFDGERPSRVVLVICSDNLTPEYVNDARDLGYLPVSIGPRTMESETAAVVGAALTQFACGDLG